MDAAERRVRYSKISTELAHLDGKALGGLLTDQPATRCWGPTQTVEIAGESVFVKVIPLTDLELAREFSTKNHYRLPTFYQYGVGSAGFGAWRELVTHIKTTNWVLEGAIDSFPLTYHFRVVPRTGQIGSLVPTSNDDYVRYWNSSRNIARYISERSTGSHAALVFVEHVPYSIWEWLSAHPDDTDRIVMLLCDTVCFLRNRGIVHFDAHFNNAMTDAERTYLADFGLVLDSRFDLAPRERAFLERHLHYDYGEILYSVGSQLAWWYEALSAAEQESIRKRISVEGERSVIHPALVHRVEHLGDAIHPALADAVLRYRDVIVFMDDFFTRMRANRRKNTPYDDNRLRELLEAAGVLHP